MASVVRTWCVATTVVLCVLRSRDGTAAYTHEAAAALYQMQPRVCPSGRGRDLLGVMVKGPARSGAAVVDFVGNRYIGRARPIQTDAQRYAIACLGSVMLASSGRCSRTSWSVRGYGSLAVSAERSRPRRAAWASAALDQELSLHPGAAGNPQDVDARSDRRRPHPPLPARRRRGHVAGVVHGQQTTDPADVKPRLRTEVFVARIEARHG
jgi:hypothetical protein